MMNRGFMLNGERKEWAQIVEKRVGRIAPVSRRLTEFSGVPGAASDGMDTGVRPIYVRVEIEAGSKIEWDRRVEELAGWVIRKTPVPLVFDSDPSRIYLAEFQGEFTTREIGFYGQVEMNFVCSFPYAIGPETIYTFANGMAPVINPGTLPTKPFFRAKATEALTHLTVWNNKGYMQIGRQLDLGQTAEPSTLLLNDPLGSTLGWSAAGTEVDGGLVTGSITSNGYSFSPSSYGTGQGWHGPALEKSVPEAPFQDFEIEVDIIFENDAPDTRGRIEWYLFDEAGQNIGKISMKRVGGGGKGNVVEARAGNASTGFYFVNSGGDNGTAWMDFRGILRLTRKDNIWTCYVAKVEPDGRHHTRLYRTFTDAGRKYMGRMATVQVHFGQSNDMPVPDLFAGGVRVKRFNPQADPIEYICQAGDVIEMDFRKGLILVNGEPERRRRDMGATFFEVPVGASNLLVSPFNKLDYAEAIIKGWYR